MMGRSVLEMPSWLRTRVTEIHQQVNAMLERGESIKGVVLVVGGPDGGRASLMTAGGPVDVRCDPWCPSGTITTAWMCSCGSLFMDNRSQLRKCDACLRAERVAAARSWYMPSDGSQPSKHGPGGKGGSGPCDSDCAKCAFMDRSYKLGDAVTFQHGISAGIRPPAPVYGVVSRVVNGRVTEMLADNGARYDVTVCPSGLRPRDPAATPKPVDPLDVEHAGVKLRTLLEVDERARRGEIPAGHLRHNHLTPAQRAAVSAHWSAELRAKVAASKADDEACALSVYCQGDWGDEVAW